MPDGSEPSQSAASPARQTERPDAPASAPQDPKRRRARAGWPSLFGRRQRGEPAPATVSDGQGRNRALSVSEMEMIERVVALEDVRVGNVAIPRVDINAIDESAALPEILTTFSEAGHSRLPVYRGDLDDPVGFVHIKDVVGLIASREGDAPPEDSPPLPAMVRKLLYAPPSMPAAELLLRMQAQRIHMALVIDEFGGTDGLVTIEDLIEEIVGDIRDEHDETDEMRLKATAAGLWDADARVELSVLEERLSANLRPEDEEADTLGGLVFSLAGRVPLRGEVIPHPSGHEFEIAEADPRRVRRVLIKLAENTPPSDEQSAG